MKRISSENKVETPDGGFSGRLYVSFSISGKEFSPDEVTAKLGIQPKISFKYGDVRTNVKGGEQVQKRSYWEISSDHQGFSQDNVVQHFEWLLAILEPLSEKINELLLDEALEAQISCFWITPDGRINLELDPTTISRFARLNLKIWFDIYCDH